MTMQTITARGQITLNKDLLRRLGVRPGDKISIEPDWGGTLTIKPAAASGIGNLEKAFGRLRDPGAPSLSLEDIDEAIGRSRAEDDDRIKREWRASR